MSVAHIPYIYSIANSIFRSSNIDPNLCIPNQVVNVIRLFNKKILQQGSNASPQSRRQSEAVPREDSPEPDFESSGSEDENEDEEKKAARLARRLAREVKFTSGKLNRLKEKQETARRERQNIRDSMKKNQDVLR